MLELESRRELVSHLVDAPGKQPLFKNNAQPIPEGLQLPIQLNQALHMFLAGGGKPEIAATAILLAQLGVPEDALGLSLQRLP